MKKKLLFLVLFLCVLSLKAQELTATISVVDETCNLGEITISATGGDGNYVYAVASTGGISSNYTSNNVIQVNAGSYDVFIRDNNGNVGFKEFVETVTISFLPSLSLVSVSTQPNCSEDTGDVTMSISDGQAPYYSTITGTNGVLNTVEFISESVFTYSGLFDGTYTILVGDANGCETLETVTIVSPNPLIGNAFLTQNYTCANTAEITFQIPTGGRAPYQYGINSVFSTDLVKNNLTAGIYSLGIRDANGCQLNLSDIVVSALSTEPVFTSQINYNCDGTGDVTIIPENINYRYKLNGGIFQTFNVFNSLPVGSHIITIDYGNSCISDMSITINDVNEFSGSILESTNVTCRGSNNGAITIEASNYSGSYEYSINNGLSWNVANETPYVIANLGAGTYDVQIRLAECNVALGNVSITEMAEILATAFVTKDITCDPFEGATINVAATGGDGVYEYSVDEGGVWQSSTIFTNLQAGTYTINVKDSNGCLSIPFPITINPTQKVSHTAMATNCNNGNNGEIVVNAVSGAGAYSFSIDGGLTWQVPVPNNSINYTFTGLTAGTYNISVKDDLGCVGQTTTHVINPQLSATTNITNISCNSVGSVAIEATGGDGNYEYALVPSGSVPVGFSQFKEVSVANSGIYDVYIRDSSGCEISFQNTVVDSVMSPDFVASVVMGNICSGDAMGRIKLEEVSGTLPLTYNISPVVGEFNSDTNTFENLPADTYTIIAMDTNGCTNVLSVVINEVSVINFATEITDSTRNDGVITVNAVVGGMPPYEYSIDGFTFVSSNTFSNLSEGDYTVTVQDSNTCLVAKTAKISNTSVRPVAQDDFIGANVAGESVTFNPVLDNDNGEDTDADGILDLATINLVVPIGGTNTVTDANGNIIGMDIPSEGVWSVNETSGEITFTPNVNFTVDPTPIAYNIEDNDGNVSNDAIITLDYNPIVTSDVSAGNLQGSTVTISVLENDIHGDIIDPTSVQIIGTLNPGDDLVVSGEGVWSINSTSGTITFNPCTAIDFPDSSCAGLLNGDPTNINYVVSDDEGNLSNSASVSISFNIIRPNAVDDTVTTNENDPVVIDVLENDSNVPAEGIITVMSGASGSVVITDPNITPNDPSDNVVTYTPNRNFTGTDTFEYTICDLEENCSTGTVTISVDKREIGAIPFSQRLESGSINLKGNITFAANNILNRDYSNKKVYTRNNTQNWFWNEKCAFWHQDYIYTEVETEVSANTAHPTLEDLYVSTTTDACDIVYYSLINNLNNGNLFMNYVDVDDTEGVVGNDLTFSSSKSTLNVPDNSKVIFAGLYWAGVYPYDSWESKGVTEGAINRIKFKTPEGEYQDIVGDIIFDKGRSKESAYVCFKNVTNELVQLTNPNGAYYAANIRATVGLDKDNGAGSSAGWNLVVIYENENESLKNISIFDGFAPVDGTNNTNVNFSGFVTLPSGPVRGKLLTASLEGDAHIMGDKFQIQDNLGDYIDVGGVVNPNNNFFNSTISKNNQHDIDRNTNSTNTLGFDVDLFDIYNANNSVIGNGQTSVNVKFTTSGDVYWPFLTAIAIELEDNSNLLETVNDIAATNENVPVVVDIFSNDSNVPTGGTIIATDPINGTVEVTDPNETPNDPSDDVVTYAPNTDFVGTDTFDYNICDSSLPANCSSAMVSVTVASSIPDLTVNYYVSKEILCSGDNDGEIVIEAQGGKLPYVYEVSNSVTGALVSGSTSNVFSNLLPSNYIIKVIDSRGYTLISSVDIYEPTEIVAVASVVSLNTIKTSVTGGLPPYTYSINGNTFVSSNTFTNLNEGDHEISVKDANGCLISLPLIKIVAPIVPIAVDDSIVINTGQSVSTGVLVNDTNVPVNGVITATTPSNGVVGITDVNRTPDDPRDDMVVYTPDANFIGVDTFEYTICDLNGNCDTATVTITVKSVIPDLIIATISNDISCFGSSDGSIEVTATGGQEPYNYELFDSGGTLLLISTSNVFTNLLAGVYTVKVTGGSKISTIENIITQPTVISATAVPNSWNSISVTAMGGNPPYEYSTDGVNYTSLSTFSNLLGGTYTVTVRDANGCMVSLSSIIISEPISPIAQDDFSTGNTSGTSVIINPIEDNGNGADVDPDGILNSGMVSLVNPGTGVNLITDADGDIVSIEIPNEGVWSVNIISGVITFVPVLGFINDPELIMYNIKDNDGNVSNDALLSISYDILEPNTIDDLALTNEGVGVTIDVLSNDENIPTFGIMSVTSSENGKIVVADPNGTGTDPSDDVVIYTPNSGFTGTDTFEYSICSEKIPVTCSTAIVTVIVKASLSIDIVSTEISCRNSNDGIIKVDVKGGTPPYDYKLFRNGDRILTSNNSNIFNNLKKGNYYVEVSDSDGDLKKSKKIRLKNPSAVLIKTINVFASGRKTSGKIKVRVKGGSGVYEYGLNGNFQSSNKFINLTSGDYIVEVRDSNGCLSFPFTVTLKQVNVNNRVIRKFGKLKVIFNNAISYQWINVDKGFKIPGATDSVFEPIESGRYQVEMIIDDANLSSKGFVKGEAENSVLSPIIEFNIDESEEVINFDVYPNPTSDYLMLPEDLIDEKYVIYDTIGNEVSKGKVEDEKLLLKTFSKGIYILKVKGRPSVTFIIK